MRFDRGLKWRHLHVSGAVALKVGCCALLAVIWARFEPGIGVPGVTESSIARTLPRQDAPAAESSGLTPVALAGSAIEVVTIAHPPFKVYAQDIAATTKVPVGSTVTFKVAKPPVAWKQVPDLNGKTKAQALFSLAAGAAAAWFVSTRVMEMEARFDPVVAGAVMVAALVLTVGFGLAGTWRVLGHKAAPVLRNE